MDRRQLVVFKINGEEFGIEIKHICSIEKLLEIFRMPGTPDFVEGIINLRGEIFAVFNLRKRFNLPAAEYDDNARIIIVNINSVTVGLIVDGVSEIISVEQENTETTSAVLTSLIRKYINGAVKMNERVIPLLDLGVVISFADDDICF